MDIKAEIDKELMNSSEEERMMMEAEEEEQEDEEELMEDETELMDPFIDRKIKFKDEIVRSWKEAAA